MYDVIIIGAGPAGISASLYTKRANLKTLALYMQNTNLKKASKIENYYGIQTGISGEKLYLSGIEQAKNIGVELLEEEVIKVEIEKDLFKVTTENGNFTGKTVIFATGINKKNPNILGLKEFEGKGVSYCAICDGFFYRGKHIAIIGNGNYAISEANDLINIANDITILTNGESAPDFRADNVEINQKKIKKIVGRKKVEKIEFYDNTKMEIDGIFVANGVAGTVNFAKKLGIIIEENKIIVNEKMETNIPGIYACGDCTGGVFQITKAVYEGTKAALAAIEFIKQYRKEEEK